MNNALELTGLTKRYPGFTLDHLTFSLPEGCIMGLIGENGAGKTTAFKLMLGLARPDEGGAHLLGRATTDRETKEHLGVVMDECGFPENLTLHDVDAIMSRCYRTWDTLRFQGWADRFEQPHRPCVGCGPARRPLWSRGADPAPRAARRHGASAGHAGGHHALPYQGGTLR